MLNYDYVNARIRSMTSQLLPRAALENLVGADSLEVLTDFLHQTPYNEDLAQAQALTGGTAAVERALAANLSRAFRKVARMVPGPRGTLTKILLKRWDLANVKMLVRARHAALPPGESLDFIPAGQIGPAALEELAAAEDLHALVDRMATWKIDFVGPLKAAMGQYEAAGNVAVLESALDLYYFSIALHSLEGDSDSRAVRTILGMEADRMNIVLALKFIKHKSDLAEGKKRFVPGGTLTPQFLVTLIEARDTIDAAALLESTRYAPAIERGVLHFGETGRISILERRLEGVVIRRAARMSLHEPMGIGPVIGYVWRKYNEFVNLRLLARAKTHGLPTGAVMEELIGV